MTRLSTLRTAAAPFIMTLASVFALTACASAGPAVSGTVDTEYGYMIAGPVLAASIGVVATDTLPELPPRTTLPTILRNAMSQEVAQGRWNDRCTRRFGGPERYAVIFHRACDSALGPEADPVVVVGFAADGRVTGRLQWTGPGTVAVLVPGRRF